MNTDEGIARAKSELRLKARAARRVLSPEQRADASSKIAVAILSLPELRDVRTVLSYSAKSEELDIGLAIEGLRERGVRVVLPRIIGPGKMELHWHDAADELGVGEFGLREPLCTAPAAPLAAIDAILTPGVAYDHQGRRLGFGGGYYDSLFIEVDSSVIRIGIAYEEQMFAELPRDEHDQPVDFVVTPERIYRPRR
ncbi:MAG: 5-formyltetrahydrofolate cyclo-ligase [Coriobacteriia bacterium]|nr:5-formyltetrahydrofolate cyclo-ligase [Coriobacteriia bacterium]